MRVAALTVVLLVATGCGAATQRSSDSEPDGVGLKSLCPGVHLAVDSLVVSDPASRTIFADQLQRLRSAASTRGKDALAPLIDAAEELVAVRTDEQFFTARDDVHAAVVEVDGGCVAAGSPILHSGPHPTG